MCLIYIPFGGHGAMRRTCLAVGWAVKRHRGLREGQCEPAGTRPQRRLNPAHPLALRRSRFARRSACVHVRVRMSTCVLAGIHHIHIPAISWCRQHEYLHTLFHVCVHITITKYMQNFTITHHTQIPSPFVAFMDVAHTREA